MGLRESAGAFSRKARRAPPAGIEKSGARRQRSPKCDRVTGEIETKQLKIANCRLNKIDRNLKSEICNRLGGFDGPETGRRIESASRIGEGKGLSHVRP